MSRISIPGTTREVILLASATRTASTSTAKQFNYGNRGALVFANVSAASGTGGLRLVLQYEDQISGTMISLADFNTPATYITATGWYYWFVYPGQPTIYGVISGRAQGYTNIALPREFEFRMVHGDATDYTYSLQVTYVP